MLDRAAQILKDWRLHEQDQPGRARRRWAKTTRVGLAGTDRFDKQTEV